MYAEASCLGRLKIVYFKGPIVIIMVGDLPLPLPSALCRPHRVIERRGYSRGFHKVLELALRARTAWMAAGIR
ncbi:hypothetical protein [Aeropyrum pernix]|uniref:hypothetical protein n=1 Tax=Aeropyrum pernix TaxID=56636 RepID=UPI0011E51ADB|nr:hypothetical protein [Aeropyrum pernix]